MPTMQPSPRDLAIAARDSGHLYPDGHYAVISHAGLTSAPQRVAEVFGVQPGAAVIRRDRVHHDVMGVPLSWSTSWFIGTLAGVCPKLLKRERIVEGTANYIAACRGTDIVRGRDVVTAVAANHEQARLLDVEMATAVQVVTTCWFAADDVAVEFGESLSVGRSVSYDYLVTSTQ